MLSRLLLILFFLAPSPLIAGNLPNSAKESVAPVVRAITPGVVQYCHGQHPANAHCTQ
jgi:hypothetical protein